MAAPQNFATLLVLGTILICGVGSGRTAPDDSATDEAATAQPDKEVPGIIRAMIEAHGGMERWASAPTVSFEDHFIPAGAPSGQPSRVMVEQGRRRTYIDFPGTAMRMAWDGEQAWSENWQMPFPPRFMAQLNYYFLNLPWLTMDPGVYLGQPEAGRLWDDPTEYVTVKMTFGESVGDSPDDYYVLYIHPETHRLKACRYIVTYEALVPEGASSTPEHILVYDEFTTVDRLVVPTRYTVYETDHSVYGTCEIRDWSFSKPFDAANLAMPEGAVLDTSIP